MFRAQQNGFDDVVIKATDENLTSENWEFIMDVVDKVQNDPSGPKDVVAALIKRLSHRNANVQLYTLELANALSQNCGMMMYKELASRSFTEALLRLAADRNTHQQVKAKILERMHDWTEMFARDPDLGIMDQAYMRLKTQNPNLHPPSKPQKTQITATDRQREEEELQMALALSIKDNKQLATSSNTQKAAVASSDPVAEAPAQPVGQTAATVSRVRALFDFTPSEAGELAFRKGDIIAVLESVYKDWWNGSLRGQTGIFPLNYVEKLQDPTRQEIEREAHMEGEVFAEMKNVEKLLALLSTNDSGRGDVRDNEEITKLYHSTLAIRPKLIELIGKYSQKKDDFTQLNEKFIKARRDYENLLEASMSHPPQPTYGRPAYTYGGGVPAPSAVQPQQGYPPAGFAQQQSAGPPQQYAPHANQPQQQQPFYFVPPAQQQGGVPSQSAPKPPQSNDDLYSGGRPHELGAGGYESPVNQRHSYGQQQQQPTYSAINTLPSQQQTQPVAQPSDPYSAAQTSPVQQQHPQQPYPAQPAPYLASAGNPAQIPQQPPQQQQYQAYPGQQRWNGTRSVTAGDESGGGGGAEAEGFYR